MNDGLTRNDDLVMSLVDEGLARPEPERENFLRKACANNTDLFDEVLTRIQWELRMNGFLLEPLLPRTEIEHPFEAGEMLAARFRLVREIGHGAMGVVYEAIDEKLEKRIAIKCAKPGFERRLPPEAINATTIAHPNVCKTYEIHTTLTRRGEVDFLTMEYLDGETLADRIRRRGRLPVSEVRDIARQVCAGLEEAHRKGVIHGDLKSSNVILVQDTDGSLRPVITDFGLARQVAGPPAARLQATPYGGTPAYMAPELWRGEKASVASDLYALGVILFEALTGHFPFQPVAEWHGQPTEKAKRISKVARHIPRRLDAIVLQCLDPDPARRPASAAEISAAALGLHPGWRIAQVAAVLVAAVMVGLPGVRQPARDPVRLAVLPFEATERYRPLAEKIVVRTTVLLAQRKPSGWRFSVIPLSASVRHQVNSAGQACRALGATHVLRVELQNTGGIVTVRAAVADACSQRTIKELELEYDTGDEGRIPLALAGVVTGSLRLPPVRSSETVNAAARPDYEAGLSKLQQETRVDDAVASLERATASDPHSPLTWAGLAKGYRLKFRVTKEERYRDLTIKAAKKAESLNPDVAPVCWIAGVLHLDSGLYARAAEDFHRAIELEPNDPDTYVGLASVQHAMGQDREATQSLLKAIDVRPRNFKSYRQLGGLYYDLGEYMKSAEQFRKVVELNPDIPEGHFSLAVSYVKLGWYAQAEHELQTALKLREDWNTLVTLGATLEYERRDQEAIGYDKRAITLVPQRSLAWVNIGDCYRRTLQPAESKIAYERALYLTRPDVLRNPQDAYARAFTAYLLARLGNSDQAEYEIGQALGSPFQDAQLLRVAALTYEALGKREKTLSVLKDAPWPVLDDLNRHPDVAGLRADPRFLELLGSHKSQK